MDAREIEIVDTVFRAYYRAYQKKQLIGIVELAKENNLELEDVERSILFLKAEKQLAFDNKGYDPVNSGTVYKLTDQGYSWFARTNYVTELLSKNEPAKTAASKPMKIFISHASANKNYGAALVDFLIGIGIKDEQIVFTSNPAYGIPIGNNIFDWLKTQINDKSFVIYLLSPEYYKSIACLNEMGASWIVENDHATIFLPGFDFDDKSFHSGAIDPREIGFFINDKDRLTQFIQVLEAHFAVSKNYTVLSQRIDRLGSEIEALSGNLVPILTKKDIVAEIAGTNSPVKSAIKETIEKGIALKNKIEEKKTEVDYPSLSSQSQKFIKDILAGKVSDAELMVLHYMIARSKYKLGTGWQTANEISAIHDWEDIEGLNHTLSQRYEEVLRKLDLRGLTTVSAVTSYDNPKEFAIKDDLVHFLFDLPKEIAQHIDEVVINNGASPDDSDDEDDDLPF